MPVTSAQPWVTGTHPSTAQDAPMDTELLSGTFVELADTMVADFDIIDFLHRLAARSVPRPGGAGRAVPDPEGPGSLPGLLPYRPARHRGRPARAGPALAPVRCRRHRRRVPYGPGGPDAAARRSHRRAEPDRYRHGPLEPGGRADRPGPGRRGHDRAAADFPPPARRSS